MGCSPWFNCAYHPSSTGLAERGVANVKQIISKLAADYPKSWHTYLPMTMWCLRKVPNQTTGVAPIHAGSRIFAQRFVDNFERELVWRKTSTSELWLKCYRIFTWTSRQIKYCAAYAASHSEREQNRYASHYNLRSRDKHFDVNKQVLILMPDSTSSRTFSKWTGPATVAEVCSPYSYIVEVDAVHKHFHANKLCKFHVRVDSVTCDIATGFQKTSIAPLCCAVAQFKHCWQCDIRPLNDIAARRRRHMRGIRDVAANMFGMECIADDVKTWDCEVVRLVVIDVCLLRANDVDVMDLCQWLNDVTFCCWQLLNIELHYTQNQTYDLKAQVGIIRVVLTGFVTDIHKDSVHRWNLWFPSAGVFDEVLAGRAMGTQITLPHFQWSWMTHAPSFKVTPFFDAEYLRNRLSDSMVSLQSIIGFNLDSNLVQKFLKDYTILAKKLQKTLFSVRSQVMCES